MAHPHGWCSARASSDTSRDALRTDDKMVHAAPPEFVARTRELLAGPHPAAPVGYPFQLANRRNRHSMNSWLNELPGLHPSGKGNEVADQPRRRGGARHRRRRSGAGVLPRRRDRARPPSLSDRPRRGVVIVDHGWGSRIFDPRGGGAPRSLRRQPQSADRRRRPSTRCRRPRR